MFARSKCSKGTGCQLFDSVPSTLRGEGGVGWSGNKIGSRCAVPTAQKCVQASVYRRGMQKIFGESRPLSAEEKEEKG